MEMIEFRYEDMDVELLIKLLDTIKGVDPTKLKTKKEIDYYFEIKRLIPPKLDFVPVVEPEFMKENLYDKRDI